jgi:hypothetical protein
MSILSLGKRIPSPEKSIPAGEMSFPRFKQSISDLGMT